MRKKEGVNISIKKTTLLISALLMFFLFLSAVSAAEVDDVQSTGNLNLIENNQELASINVDDSNQQTDLANLQKENSDDSSNVALESSNTPVVSSGNSTNTTKVDTKLSISNARYSQSAEFKVVLKDTNGKALGNQSIILNVNGKSYKATTGNDGSAYVQTACLKKGTYTATVSYGGDTQYNAAKLSKKVSVVTSIVSSSLTKVYGDDTYYVATFYQNSKPLTNTTVQYNLNGKRYSVKTDSNGAIKISTNLKAGKYAIKLYNPYSKELIQNTITVKKSGTKLAGLSVYILPKTKYSYSVTLKTQFNKAIKKAKIYFNYNNRQVSAYTDAKGKATITLPALSKGTYAITYRYYGNSNLNAASRSKKLLVRDSTTTLKGNNLKMQYNDGSTFSVKATSSGKSLANKTIKFNFNGKTTTATTDSKGIAKLAIGDVKPGTYTVKSAYSTAGKKDYNIKSNSIVVTKQTLTLVSSNLVMKYNDGSSFQITLKNKKGAGVSGITVKFTFNGKNTKVTTDANGVAKLAISENIGYYTIITQTASTTYYPTAKATNHILVNGTKFEASDMTIPVNTAGTFSVKVIDGQSKPVSTNVKFTLDSKVQTVHTDSNGIAKLSITGLSKGTHTVTYTDGSTTGSSKILSVDKVTLKEVITASQNVKKYIESNGALPKTVTIGSTTYSLATYVYLASQAIINLKANSKADIAVKSVKDPSSPKAAANLGELTDYLSVAKSVVSTVNSKGTMPNSVSSKVGTIGYNGLAYATARVVAFYGDNGIMPNYVTIKTYNLPSTDSSLNSKNTITNLKPYLAASTNCQVGNAKIKSVVTSLTSGLTSDLAKARAIYNYVRDAVSYSFYYDTKYGAVGTLNAKTGNCVDQAHLLIAMYRTAGLAARYAHGTCTFSSGTYGHVWAQVLIGNTWIVSDPTSVRNSFGNVVNWNNNNYRLHGYYSSISF